MYIIIIYIYTLLQPHIFIIGGKKEKKKRRRIQIGMTKYISVISLSFSVTLGCKVCYLSLFLCDIGVQSLLSLSLSLWHWGAKSVTKTYQLGHQPDHMMIYMLLVSLMWKLPSSINEYDLSDHGNQLFSAWTNHLAHFFFKPWTVGT